MSTETPSNPRLEKAAAALRHVIPPDELRQRIAAAVFTERPAPRPAPRQWPVWLRPGLSLTAVAASAGLLALFWQAPISTPSGKDVAPIPGVAFARVEEALQDIDSVCWKESSTSFSREGKSIRTSSSEVWAGMRMRDATLCRRTILTPENTGGVTETLQTSYLTISRSPTRNYSIGIWDKSPPKESRFRHFLEAEVLFPRGDEGKSEAYRLNKRIDVKTSPWKADRVTLEDKDAVRFRRTISMIETSGVYMTGVTLYADPNTYQLVRREIRVVHPNAGRVKYQSVASDFRYNQSQPFTLRDLTPPPGTWFSVLDLRRATGKANVSATTRAEIQSVMQQAGNAWSDGDWNRFSALWDWNYYDRTLPEGAYAPKYTTQGYVRNLFQSRWPHAEWQADQVVAVQHAYSYYSRRRSDNASFPEIPLPGVYQAKIRLSAQATPGGVVEHPTLNVLLVRTDGGLRIAHANFGGYSYVSPLGRSHAIKRSTHRR